MMQIVVTQYCFAQTAKPTIDKLVVETRCDFAMDLKDGKGGFSGRYLNFIMAGSINDKLSYSYRQRINAGNMGFSTAFFEGTDWAYLTYKPISNLSLSAGKQVVQIGGFEYDAAPIDIYFASDFWNHVNCYEMGASATLSNDAKTQSLTFQFSNSPFVNSAFEGLYAFNLLWNGDFGFFKTLYSANMIEYQQDKYINYIALGNSFQVSDNLAFHLDFMNRASFNQDVFFFKDATLILEGRYNLNDKAGFFFKIGRDWNDAQDVSDPSYVLAGAYDQYVIPGTNRDFRGLGFEYYPFKNSKDLRLHAFLLDTKSGDAPDDLQGDVGLTWRLRFK